MQLDASAADVRVENALTGMFRVEQAGPGLFDVYSYGSDTEYRVDALDQRCTCDDPAPTCKHRLRVVLMRPALLEAVVEQVDPIDYSGGGESDSTPLKTDGGVVAESSLPDGVETVANRIETDDDQEETDVDGDRAPDNPDPGCPDCDTEVACLDCCGL